MAGNTDLYLRFLESPTTGHLADDASLNYITTTTVIREPAAILKHIAAQNRQVIKKEQKVLNVIESGNSSCIETVTTVQFRMGGGTYLPGMDANLIDEREVTFPLIHIVVFSPDEKIQQIRLYWDQGTLLKQVEAIGKSGRNWPIRDGRTQGDAIASSVKTSGTSTSTPNASQKPAKALPIRDSQKRESVSVVRDPHSHGSLSLFNEQDPSDDGPGSYAGPKHARRESAKPPPRDYGELFVSSDAIAAASSSATRGSSPHKSDGTILKAGAGKNFGDIRLFDETEEDATPLSPERKKTFDQKYQHFAFGNGEDALKENRPMSGRGNAAQGGGTTFSFEDFATPLKVQEKHRPDYERHWGPGIDAEDPGSPPKRPIVHAARPDVDNHFSLTDESPPAAAAAGDQTKTLQRQRGMGLYQDPTFADDRTAVKQSSPAPTQTTNVNKARRGDEYSMHYTMADDSPAASKVVKDTRGTRSDMTANWGFGTPVQERKIYKTAGDGMGSRKGGRGWGIGDESDPEVDDNVRPTARTTRRSEYDRSEDLDF